MLGRLLQHRIETVEDRHSTCEELMVIWGAARETFNGEIQPDGLLPRELPVVQIRLVHDLGDELDAAVFEGEALDQRLEGAVLAVVPEVRAQDIKGDALACG